MLVPQEKSRRRGSDQCGGGRRFDSILYHVLDHYFGLPPTDWVAAFKSVKDREVEEAAETMKRAEAARAADSKPSLPLEKYAGVYNDAWYGPITVRMENSGLVINFRSHANHDRRSAALQFDTFKAHWRDRTIEDAFLTFSLNPDGSIDSARMAAVSPLADFSFDYQDLLFKPAAQK